MPGNKWNINIFKMDFWVIPLKNWTLKKFKSESLKMVEQGTLRIPPSTDARISCQKQPEATFSELWNLIKKIATTGGYLTKEKAAKFW